MSATIRQPADACEQARALLEQHRRMSVGAAIEHGGPVADAIAEVAFSVRDDWTYAEARERVEQLRKFTMSVGQWLGRYHTPRQPA